MIEQYDDRLAIWGTPGAGMNFIASLLSKHEILIEANNEYFFVQRGQREIGCGHLDQEYYQHTRQDVSKITPSEYRRLIKQYKIDHPLTKHLVILPDGWAHYIKGLLVAKRRANLKNYEHGKLHPRIARTEEVMRRGTQLTDGWEIHKYREPSDNKVNKHYQFAASLVNPDDIQTVTYRDLFVTPDVQLWEKLVNKWKTRLTLEEVLGRVAVYHDKNVQLLRAEYPELNQHLDNFLLEMS